MRLRAWLGHTSTFLQAEGLGRLLRWGRAACWAGLLGLSLRAMGKAPSYTIIDLGTLGGSYSEAHGLNISGGVVGDFDPGSSPFVQPFYFQDGTNGALGTLGGVYGVAYGINQNNIIAGESSSAGGFSDIHAFAWENGAISDLGTLGGIYNGGYSSAHAINRAGQIAGESSVSSTARNTTHAVLYNAGTKTDLDALDGNYSSANAINGTGMIVGATAIIFGAVTNIHAFVYSSSGMRELGTLGGGYSSARAVNDSGVVAGEAEAVDAGVTNLHAFVWRNGQMADLGTFGGSSSSAGGINSAGQIVGYAYDPHETSWAFVCYGTNLVNLFDKIPTGSGWTNLTSADAINDLGQIAGSGLLTNGGYHAFLLTPLQPQVAPLTLTSAQLLADGSFRLTMQGSPGQSFALEASNNLLDWVSLTTNTLSGTSTDYLDATAPGHVGRYYRAVSIP